MKKTKLFAATVLSLTIFGTVTANVSAADLDDCNSQFTNKNSVTIYNQEDLQSFLKNNSDCTPNINISDLLNNGNCTEDNKNNNGGDNSGSQNPGTEKPGTGDQGSGTPGTDNPDTETPAPEIPDTETPDTETPDTETPDTETPSTEAPAAEDKDEDLTFAEQVVELVNEEREKYGLSPLTIDKNVEAAALVRANEIQSSFSHTRLDGSAFYTALKDQNVSYRGAGENIAYGQKTPEAVMEAWMNSSGHRANILNENFTTIGVGYLQNSQGTNYWTQLFTY